MNSRFLKKWYPRFFAKPRFRKMNVALVRYGLRGLGILNYSSHSLTGESFFLSWLVRTKQPKVIFDVGANKGDYSKLCREHGFQGLIYGFEPNPVAFKKLSDNIDSNSKIFNIGLSDKSGEFELFYQSGNDSSTHATMYKDSLLTIEREALTSCSIELQTLDQFTVTHNIKTIDLLKIDTEGNEFKVLLGASQAFEQGIIKAIQFEFNGINVVSRVFFKDFFDLLAPKYNLYRLLPNSFLPIKKYDEFLFLELFAFQNIIAIRKV